MASAIPVIDIHNPCLSEDQIARELVDAAVEHGFVYIRNKGTEIPPSDVHAAFDLSRTLFASPAGVKQKCAIQTNNRGWSGMHSETLDPKNQRVRLSFLQWHEKYLWHSANSSPIYTDWRFQRVRTLLD